MLTFKNVNIITRVLLLVFALLKVLNYVSILWLIFIGVVWLILTIIGSFHIRWNYFLKAKHHNYQVKDNMISITFDDGPNKEFTPKVLALLGKHHAKATFFLIGNQIEENQELVKEIIDQGHTIGNHTFSHTNNFGFLKIDKVISDLEKNKALVEQLFQLKMNLFRPAFGVTNPRISKAVKKLNLETFGWSVRSLDTTKDTKEKIYKRITQNIRKGDVVLFHDTCEKSVEVLEQFLVFLEKKKLGSVTIDQLFNTKAYE